MVIYAVKAIIGTGTNTLTVDNESTHFNLFFKLL